MALVLGIGAGSGLSLHAAGVVADLIGKHRSEITEVFPGGASIIRDWHGWESVFLVLGRDGRLVGVGLQPRGSISEQEAEDAVRELGVNVERSKYFAGSEERGYSDMTGPIRTVIYDVGADEKVTNIRIHSALADAER